MNDYSEVQHGLDRLKIGWNSGPATPLAKLLDGWFPGIVKEIDDRFWPWQKHLLLGTHILSLSEHAGEGRKDEDRFGRLSMWRGYARDGGVAIVIKQDPMWTADQSLGLYTTPVAYLDDDMFAIELARVAGSIQANADFVRGLGRENVRNSVLNAFFAAAVSTKHIGFREELEWRVARVPSFPFPCPLEVVTKQIKGVEQKVVLLKLEDRPPGLVGIEPPALLDRIIIGPTADPKATYAAYLEQMKASGIDKPEQKLFISDLPLRPE